MGIIGTLATGRWWRTHPRGRRGVACALAALLAVVSVFPIQYRAASTMIPTDPAGLGLGGALQQLGGTASLFNSQAAIEIGLKVARSMEVRRMVIARLDLIRRLHFRDARAADRWVERKVYPRALRGGILQIEMKNRDPAFALSVVSTFTDALRHRLSEISRSQTAYKRAILTDLVENASERLARAQAAYDAFRRQTRFSEPTGAISAIGQRVPVLRQELKDKEVELRAARSFATDENMSVRQILAQMAALRAQLAEAESLDGSQVSSVNRAVAESTQVLKLERELLLAQTLYDNYRRYLQGTAVEDLASLGNVRVLEPPYIDSDWQYRTLPAALALLVVMIALATEFYLARPPLGVLRDAELPAR